MNYLLRLLCLAVALVATFVLPSTTYAQTFNGQQQKLLSVDLQNQLQHWEIYQMDAAALYSFVKDNPQQTPAQIQLGQHHWRLALTPGTITGPNYTLKTLTEHGVEITKPTAPKAFRGNDLAGGGQARLTLDEDFIYGFVEEGGERYYIEPLWYYVPTAAHDLFVLYAAKDVNRDNGATCAVVESAERLQHLQNSTPTKVADAPEFMACYQVELAIASDRSMFIKYGSVGGVQNHNIGVLNNTEADYTSGSFNHNLFFVIVTQFVSTTTDPWTNSTDAGTLLDSFVAWGNSNGFEDSYDLGELWTNRDFNGGTVGIAYLDAVCTSIKYHCLQDFTGNGEILRCMTSHEIGHNFSCDHDGTAGSCPPNFIMCPFVSNTSVWSAASISAVNSFIVPLIANGCLSFCGGGNPLPLVADFDWSPDAICTGTTVQFSDLSTGDITGHTWLFPSGTPSSSTQTNPSVRWNTPGIFTVKLTIAGSGGPISITKQVTVSRTVETDFTYTAAGRTVSFNNNSNYATSFLWNFGDGQTSTDDNPVHTYNVAGTYEVKLTAFNDCGSVAKTYTIVTEPTANFITNHTSGCAPLNVQFTNLSSANAASYLWEFPGGTPATSNQYDPSVVYSTPGTYTVTLTATNAIGSASFVQTDYIIISGPPAVAFSSTVAGATASFTNTSTNAASYVWNFGDNTAATPTTSPTHTYAANGTYTVTLTAANSCGASTTTHTVVIATTPTAGFTAATTSGCAPLTVQFTSTSSANTQTYNWQFPGGTPSSSTAQNPSVVYSTAGTYSVTLTASNAAGTNTATQTDLVVVNPGPSAAFGSTVAGTVASFTNTSTNATTYAWNFGDNSTATTATPSHTYAADGTYTVTLTATNACGTNTTTHTVIIANAPTANFTATNNSGCGPLTVQFSSASSLNAQTFSWQFPGGTPATSTTANPTVVYNTAGTYSVTLTVSNATGSNTTTQTNLVTVNPGPTAAFSNSVAGTTASFTNTSTNATTYAWNFGDNATATTTTASHTYTADGTYTVTLTATNACGTNTATQTVVIASSPTANFTATNASGCGPLTVQFNSASSLNAQTYNWQFPGGTPGSSTASNPIVVYSTAGTYSVTLTVSNAAGNNTATQTNMVVVNPSPAAAFSSTMVSTTASFTNASTNATAYAWNFGDNTNATTTTPSHTYTADGTYTVTLTSMNGCGTSTATQTVVVATLPTANFTSTGAVGCGPLSVQFTSTSSPNAQTFNWQFPGGTPSSSTVANPTVMYNTAGTYSVTLTVSNAAGTNTATQTNLVAVDPSPSAAFGSTVNGTTASFTNTSTNAATYSWSFGDNTTATTATPSHTYSNSGTYTVTLTATNNCGTSTATHTVTVVAATAPTANFTAANTTGCGPLTVQFTNTSSANAQTFNWQFPGGTPSSSTAQNPTVVYNTAGTYSATLTATNAAGTNTATQTNLVTVNPSPTAAFSNTVAGVTTSFTNTSTNATTYAWNFGDNGTATTATPSHTYTADGTYTVTLTATNNCGTSTATHTVVIVTAPTANFTTTNTSGCGPLTVQFTNTSSANAQTFNWQFPGGTPSSSTAPNPVVVYNTAGTYSATLAVTNAAGTNTATQTDLVVVNAGPTAAFSSTVTGANAVFTNTSANATTYAWDFGDNGTAITATPSHTYLADGTYVVKLTATNSCGTSTFTQNVVVITSPNAGFTANMTTGCAALSVQFSDLSSGNTTAWSWTFPGGTPATSTAQNPTVLYETPGTYDVKLIASSTAGSNTYTQDGFITIVAAPTAGFTSVNSGLAFTFTNTSSNATSYTWDFGDGSSSSDSNPTHTFVHDSLYQVTLTAINNCGTTTYTQEVSISTAPTAAFTTSTNKGCMPLTVQFTNQSSSNVATFAWTFEGGNPATSSVANPAVIWTQPGIYNVLLLVSTTAGTDTASTIVTVSALPTAAFTTQPTGLSVAFHNTSANGTTYEWKFGDNTTSTEQNPTHNYTVPGTYTVELTVTNSCGAATLQQTFTVATVGASEPEWLSKFRVYPNPNTGRFTVEMQGKAQQEVEFTLFDVIGQLVYRQVTNFGTGDLNQILDCTNLPAAMYTLRISAGEQSTYVKIVVQR